jgi:pyruvate/2-oxoglutarate/acetoin dehydrogenase E1 component
LLFSVKQDVATELYSEPLDKAKIMNEGKDITVVAYGDGFIAAQEALALIGDAASVELIDLVSLNPIDHETIFASVKKTGRLLCVDTTNEAFNVGSEIIAKVAHRETLNLSHAPVSLSCPNVPCPTSTALTEFYYPTKVDIANAVLRTMGKPEVVHPLTFEELHLAPTFTI